MKVREPEHCKEKIQNCNGRGHFIGSQEYRYFVHETLELDGFNKMPEQAQQLLLECIDEVGGEPGCQIKKLLCTGCGSPIEYVYGIALCIVQGIREGDIWQYYDDGAIKKSCEFDVCPQYEIEVDGKTYFPDFLLTVDYFGADIEGLDQTQEIVVECDGYEYHHATKEQVNHDNERELAIKKAGYDLLRFSGSQIYNDPLKCANETVDYIIAEMDRRCFAEGTDG